MHKIPIKLLLLNILFINIVFFIVNLKFHIEKYLFFSVYVSLVYLAVMYFNGLFVDKRIRKIDLIFKTIKISIISLVTIAACAYIDWTFRMPRFMMIAICLLNAIWIYIIYSIYYSRYLGKPRCILVGRKAWVSRNIEDEYDILGFVDDQNRSPIANKPWLGYIKDIRNLVDKYMIRTIIFALGESDRSKILATILSCCDIDIAYKTIPELQKYVVANDNTSFLSDIIVRPANIGYMFFKRIIDIFVSLLMIIILGPVFIIISILIKLDSKGPIFYKQDRLGRYGKEFGLFKFRTMIPDAEKDTGPVIITHKTKDPRVTRLGFFLRSSHLDELPQLWNILNGDMTFVGPRPERAVFSEELDNILHDWNKRLYIKPGLTGFAQIACMGSLEPENKIEKDLYYLKNMSFIFDLKIVILTAFKILRGR